MNYVPASDASSSPRRSSSRRSRALLISTTRNSAGTSTATSIRTLRLAGEVSPSRGLLDTSVVTGIDEVDASKMPAEISISALTLAELSTGPQAALNELERARRQDRIQRVEAETDVLSFESRCARAYGQVYAAVATVGRKARGGRAVDLLIAATALAYELPLYTLNPGDFRGLDELIEIVDVSN